jgi:hypothetical protein
MRQSLEGSDPEFGTRAALEDVKRAIADATEIFNEALGPAPVPAHKNLVEVVRAKSGPIVRKSKLILSDQQMRVIRYCLTQTLESLSV